MNVLVIPEDARPDQYVLRPILQRMMREAGTPRAKVQICMDPILGGIEQVLKWDRIQEVVTMCPMTDLFVLTVDRDGEETRCEQMDC